MGSWFGVLGALEVVREGVPLAVPAPKQRIALATLLLRANQHVSIDLLAERMWDGREIPGNARGAVQTHIGRLRRTLLDQGGGQQLIHTREEGYVLRLAAEDLDATVFLDLVNRAKRARQAGDAAGEAGLLRRASALWRGPALVDVPSESLHRDHVLVLNEQRVQVLERWFELGLRAGRHEEMLVELRAATAAHPLRERLWAQLMIALHRSGLQAEALRAYHTVSDVLRRELGVDPGDELRKLHHDILVGDRAVLVPPEPRITTVVSDQPGAGSAPAPEQVPPRQLPADIAHFTGRLAQLATLDELLSGSGGRPPRPVVLDGTAGVGKTALAVHWGHLAREHFPDGQLYLDLRGFGPGEPVEPAAALEALLRALGVAAEQLPADLDARSALLRTLMARRRVLMLLDNARDEAQVRPLLPGGPSQVLITSRNQLRGLTAREGASRVTLDPFSPDEAHSLLATLLDEERLRGIPEAETELGELCSRLPLALSIAAANLDANPHLSLADYVSELREGNRLAALQAGSDQSAAVRATLDLSYTALPEPQRKLFRLLGLMPGADFTVEATAAQAGCTRAEARRGLDLLASFHLIRMHVPGRYTFHDLLRLYAAERARSDESAGEPARARARLHDWYLHSVLAAARLLHDYWVRLPPPPPASTVEPMAFDTTEDAVAWLEAEHATLMALIQDAHRHGQREIVWRLTDALRGHFWMSRRLGDWLACVQVALAAAVAAGDRAAEAVMQLSLGNVQTFQDGPERSMQSYARAVSLAEEIDWPDCRAFALTGLANTYLRLGYPQQAVDHLNRSLTRSTGHGPVAEMYLNNLAVAYNQLGELELALEYLKQAVSLSEDDAAHMCNLGDVTYGLGRLHEAARHLDRGIALSRQAGDRGVELECVVLLAAISGDLGRHGEALELGARALAMSHELEDRLLEAAALNALGAVHHDLGRYHEALEHRQRALDASKQGNNCHPEVVSLIGLATATRSLGRLAEAAAHAERAHAIARDRSFRVLEGLALTALAEVGVARGARAEAISRLDEAIRLHRASGHLLGEARALRALGDALEEEEGAAAALPYRRRALALFSDAGSPEAARVSRLLQER
ncbi:BTAD domain-containing putative transcriptional regulator [Nonomuraea sp. NPDC050783]|uniref:AfsR/SARP family transcriptional regulator n=1 Tax=Nonomuraea sp. NPDC050783 TaxID=3154634 RepID=UPI0034656800